MIFILIHGSWHTGEAWSRVTPILEEQGATVYTPTLSGMESRQNPGGPDVGLNTHIQDIVQLIEAENLQDVTLVGHSYSGFVISGVADKMPGRISRLIYLDAFIPENDESLFDILGPESETGMKETLVNAAGQSKADGATEVWLLPPGNAAGYLGKEAPPEDVAWLQERLVYKPVLTFAEKLHMTNPDTVRTIPSVFIRCTQFAFLAAYEEKARKLGWPIYHINTGHDAMITKPQEVAETLLRA